MGCFEVSAIDGYQRAARFENRVCFLGQRLTASIRKSRRQPTDGVELTDKHGWRRCGRLTNLIEGEFGEAFKAHRRHPYTKLSASVVPIAFRRRAVSKSEQCISEPVDGGNACKSIIDCRRQRADRDLNHVRNAELTILSECAVTADVDSLINRYLKCVTSVPPGRLLRAARRGARTGPDGI